MENLQAGVDLSDEPKIYIEYAIIGEFLRLTEWELF